MPWYQELGLDSHGAQYLEPELNVAMLLSDNTAIEWWTDLERTAESFAQLSEADAQRLRVWAEDFREIVDDILIPEAQRPPRSSRWPHPDEVLQRLRRCPVKRGRVAWDAPYELTSASCHTRTCY